MRKITTILLLGIMLFLTACGAKTSQPVEQPAAQMEPAEEVAQLAPEPVQQEVQALPPASDGGMMDHWAPQDLFRLSVPSGWTMQEDTQSIEKTTVQTFTAPDGNAFVQVLANKVNTSLNHVLKGQVTLDYMKRLYGADLRVASDVTLADGREKLEWWSNENKISGTTYFDMSDNYLYFFTVAYNDRFENDYTPVLNDVVESYYQE